MFIVDKTTTHNDVDAANVNTAHIYMVHSHSVYNAVATKVCIVVTATLFVVDTSRNI